MQKVKVVSVEDGGWYSDENTSGSTVNVTLCKGDMFAKCEGILIWDEDGADDDTFDEWVAMAQDGEEGYSVWVE
jgi:hypothetical protein